MRSLEQVNIRTNVRTYVRTYSHTYVRDRPYIPSTTLLCEGIIRNVKNYSFFTCYFFLSYDAKNLAHDKLWMLGGATMDSFPKSQDAQLRRNEIIKDDSNSIKGIRPKSMLKKSRKKKD